MAVAVASAPVLKLDRTDAAADALLVTGHGHGVKSRDSIGHHNGGQSLSPFNNGHFDLDLHHNGHAQTLRCSRCLCPPVECQCIESHQVGPAYCPNPNETDIPREFETHVQIFVRVPEMQEVEETHYKKEVFWEKRCVTVPKSVVTFEEVEHFEMVPVVKYVTKTRPETVYCVVEEEIEVTVIEHCVEYEDVCVVRKEPKVITEEVEEVIKVPVVKEVEVTKMVEEWTGKYCESEVEKFCSPGDFNLICEDSCHQHSSGHHSSHRRSSRASSVSGDSPSHHHSASKHKLPW